MATSYFNTPETKSEDLNKNIFGASRTALYDDSGANLVLFDAVLQETSVYTSKISENPAEDGVVFSDMQSFDPVVVTLKIIQSNNPIDIMDLSSYTQLGIGLVAGLAAGRLKDETAAVLGTVGVGREVVTQNRGAAVGSALAVITSFLLSTGARRDIEAFTALRLVQKLSTKMLIVTPFQSYSNMLLRDISVSKDSKSSTALVADLTFQQVLVYSTESVKIVKGKTHTDTDKGTPKAALGNKQTKEATPAQVAKAKGSSILISGLRLLGAVE